MNIFAEEHEEKKDKPGFTPLNQKLLETRTIRLFGEIDMETAQDVTRQLLVLAADSDEPIKLIINSPGGHVESGDTIYDMIRFVNAPVKVIGNLPPSAPSGAPMALDLTARDAAVPGEDFPPGIPCSSPDLAGVNEFEQSSAE